MMRGGMTRESHDIMTESAFSALEKRSPRARSSCVFAGEGYSSGMHKSMIYLVLSAILACVAGCAAPTVTVP